MKKHLPVIFFIITLSLLTHFGLYAQDAEGKDCASPIILKNKSSISEIIQKSDRGKVNDFAEGSASCLAKGEKFPFWYQFTSTKNDNLSFIIEGSEGTDWDWVLYELTDDCNSKKEIACNGSLNLQCSNTGASTERMNAYKPSECDESNPFHEDIKIKMNSTYILYLNCTDCRKGNSFRLLFDGKGRF